MSGHGELVRKGTALLGAVFAICLEVGVASRSASANEGDALLNVGFRILQVPRPSGDPLTVALWYPTMSGPVLMHYVQAAGTMAADVARDARPAEGPFPLIIFSHGGGGCAVNGAVFAEELAAHGFAVAGCDHADEFTAGRSDGTLPPDRDRAREWVRWAHGVSAGTKKTAYDHRPREIAATIDAVLAESANEKSPLHGMVDPERIGMTGVSFGAWTALAVSGTIPFYRDPRIKAVAPIAGPAGKGAMIDRTAGVRIPLLLIFGEEEGVVLGDLQGPRKTPSMVRQYESAGPPKLLVGIRGARHLHFGGAGSTSRAALRGGPPPSAHVRAVDPVIRTTNAYLVAFFRRYLIGDPAAETRLKAKSPEVFLFRCNLE